VEEGDRLLHEEGRRDLLGRDVEPEVPGGLLDRHGAGAAGARRGGHLDSADATRRIAASDLYQNDGIHYLTRRPAEILTSIHVPDLDGWRSTYWKLRRRGAFDFPVLSIAIAAKLAADGTVEAARVVLGAVASRPIAAPAAVAVLIGRRLTDETIAEAAERAAQPAKPMDNTDFSSCGGSV
jgi:4-hydroxybenzoyl-CoA reductase subunit beta